MISESRVPENGMPGLMSGDWKRSTVSGPQRRQFDAWTAPDLSATAPALDSTPTPAAVEDESYAYPAATGRLPRSGSHQHRYARLERDERTERDQQQARSPRGPLAAR